MICTLVIVWKQVSFPCVVMQLLFECFSSPMNATHDSSDRNIKDFSDLLVGESFDISQQYGDSEVLRNRFDGCLDLFVGDR